MTTILPLQQSQPIVDLKTGAFTGFFKRWTDQILQRLGGITGGIYNKLTVNAGSIFWDLNSSPNAELTLTSGTNVMDTPINIVAGLTYNLIVVQPSSGANGVISWPDPPFRFAGGVPPTLSTANNEIDYLSFFSDGTNIYHTVFGKNYS